MQFKFDANQEHQVRAVEVVADLFDGQARFEVAVSLVLGGALRAVSNRLDLAESTLLANLRKVQRNNGLPEDSSLQYIEAQIDTGSGAKAVQFPNFSIEMETGTGKTYVYIRTALELFKRFGFRKFVVVVPSIAIREGVLKDLQITGQHFRELYGNVPYRFYVYDSATLSQVRKFALSDSIEILIMTIDSFNKATNVIRQPTDRLQGETPIHFIQATRPILILDEPQNMESELRVRALSALDPLFALRYSATHRNPYNLVYRLTPFDAYRQGLVKQIEVASVVEDDDLGPAFVRVERIDAKKRSLTVRLTVRQLMRDGTVKEKSVTVRPGDSLERIARRPEYASYDVEEINAGGGFVRFANGAEVSVGEARGADRKAIFEAQIQYTVEEHFRKAARLRPAGVKVLSLFFIDRVDNYVREDGLIRTLFLKSFNEIKAKDPAWEAVDPRTVHEGYFAQRRRKSGVVEFLDSVSGETREDEAAYDLIMKNKERLLSFDEPASFIFSHSALREGWDNPNIFQICTLNQTASEIKKRQEVGRGIRLARNQAGERVHDERINILTVVANESYELYVSRLQSEIESEYGAEGIPPKPVNARKRGTAKLRKEYTLLPEFRELWERIKHKTRYAVKVDTGKLVSDVVPLVGKIVVRPPRVAVTKAQVQVGTEDAFEAIQMSAAKTLVDLVGRYPLPNLIEVMTNLLEQTSPPVRLTRETLLAILKATSNRAAAVTNPYEFAAEATRIIKDRLADHLVDGIQYEKIDEWYEMAQFEAEIESWENYLVPASRSIYDHVELDSQIERDFVEGLEKRSDVKLYVKLPSWFTVHTPIGEYNPDWAIVMEDRDPHGLPTGRPMLYLVRETKGGSWKTELRPSEHRKITCGERHFREALGVDYRVVSSVAEL